MVLVVILLFIFLIIRMPVGFAIGISGVAFFLQHPELPITTTVQVALNQTQNLNLLAIPLFIFVGSLMNLSGITSRLLSLSMLLVGHMKGGLAQVSVVLAALMGGISGSANADIAMLSRILGPDMEKQGYPKGYTGAIIGYSSVAVVTIPPGISLILYGTIGNVSIGRLFSAGLIAGIYMTIFLMILVWMTSKVYNLSPARSSRAGLKDILLSLKESIWAIMFPILLLVGIRFGLFTTTEIGAIACAYVLLVGVFVYKEINFKTLMNAINETVISIGVIMFMIAMSAIFGYGIPIDKVPQMITELITGITSNSFIGLAIIVLILIIFGMFMDGSIIIILLAPILIPITKEFGYDPVFFGIVVTIIVTIGILTPPVGIGMYTLKTMLNMNLNHFLKASTPFFLLIIAFVLLMTLFPEVVLFLPDMLYG
ncbi:TRAP transporter large permease [Neobacillus niacini]|uniref:TRAP transporter large permease n=1 Tax=Neobacillus niacini TaxID=86668 RepID=UPI002FFFE062